MSDHAFCRAYLKTTRNELTAEQARRLKGAWSYMYDLQGEYQVPADDFYWHGSAHCAYDARAQGIAAWLETFYPEEQT